MNEKTNSKAASRFQKTGLYIVVFSGLFILAYLVWADIKDTDAFQLATAIFLSLNIIFLTIIRPRYFKYNKPTKDDDLATIVKRLLFITVTGSAIIIFPWIVGPLLFEIVGGRSMLGLYIIIGVVAFIFIYYYQDSKKGKTKWN